ncbi:MAG: helix-turn-helix transcriptional regulator [Clostridiales bacterium]|nr:helix-turn-helix transcriptional regulator [Clostridiales bacterium]
MEISEAMDITPEYYSALECGKKKPSMNLHVDFCLKYNKPSDCFFKPEKNNRYLSTEQMDSLMNVNTGDLETILNVLQVIYDNKKS